MLFSEIKRSFSLNQQPYKIGDTITIDKQSHVIIGIQRFHFNLLEQALHVQYITQLLQEPSYTSCFMPKDANLVKASFTYSIKLFKKSVFDNVFNAEKRFLELHDLAFLEKRAVMGKIVEFLELEFVGTDLKISALMQPLHPMKPDKIRHLHKKERLKNLIVIKQDN